MSSPAPLPPPPELSPRPSDAFLLLEEPRSAPPVQEFAQCRAVGFSAAQQQPERFAQRLQGAQGDQTRLAPGGEGQQGEVGWQQQGLLSELTQPRERVGGGAVVQGQSVLCRQHPVQQGVVVGGWQQIPPGRPGGRGATAVPEAAAAWFALMAAATTAVAMCVMAGAARLMEQQQGPLAQGDGLHPLAQGSGQPGRLADGLLLAGAGDSEQHRIQFAVVQPLGPGRGGVKGQLRGGGRLHGSQQGEVERITSEAQAVAARRGVVMEGRVDGVSSLVSWSIGPSRLRSMGSGMRRQTVSDKQSLTDWG